MDRLLRYVEAEAAGLKGGALTEALGLSPKLGPVAQWGLQIERIIDRKQEHALYAWTPKSEPGGVAAFGELRGLRNLRPGKPLELTPYLLSNASLANVNGNPLVGNRDLGATGGLDARYRLTPSMIVLPDRSHTRAVRGMFTSAPAATIAPSRITTVPFSMTLPGAMTSRALVFRLSHQRQCRAAVSGWDKR